ncbi:SRPBCC family protein [Desertihabitans aurantiacus]|uniref:SRPBCC family protein n=1 Tax=Desertihabitans aurantiacus TaxID=2282477 RepID=UPI000DF85692|nr:SRPBCC family protein [Desertihabitans aurantiacus]
MSPTPTGRLTRTAAGADLVLVRTFRAPRADVWAALTESERTARWIGPWTGEPGAGRTVRLTMTAEDEEPTGDLDIVACEAPSHLRVRMVDEYGAWDLEAHLSEADGVTTLEFVQHLTEPGEATDTGPGWEYYLDRFASVVTGGAEPDFADYHPSMVAHYRQQLDASA